MHVCLFIHDEGNFLRQVYPDLDPADPPACKRALVELQAGLGADAFVRLLHGIYPDWIVYGGVNVDAQAESWEVKTGETRDGPSIVRRSTVRTPGGTLEQEFTVSESVDAPHTFWYACTKKPVRTEKDLDLVMRYEPSMDAAFPGRVKSLAAETKRELGERGVLAVWAPGAAFNHASMLVELSDLYSLFLTDRAFYEELLRFCIGRTLPFLGAVAEAGFDVVCVGGNVDQDDVLKKGMVDDPGRIDMRTVEVGRGASATAAVLSLRRRSNSADFAAGRPQ